MLFLLVFFFNLQTLKSFLIFKIFSINVAIEFFISRNISCYSLILNLLVKPGTHLKKKYKKLSDIHLQKRKARYTLIMTGPSTVSRAWHITSDSFDLSGQHRIV